MAESSWPFDNQDTTESQYSTLLGRAVDTGVAGGLEAYGDASGMFVKLPAGLAVVRGFVYSNDNLVTLPVAPAGSTARTDLLVLRLDLTANSITATVKTGATDGTIPALTQTDGGTWETPIALVAVPASATTVTAANVGDARLFTSQPFGQWTTATRPAPSTAKAGYNRTLAAPEFHDGTTWRPFSQAGTDASSLTSGTLRTARLDYGVVAAVTGDRAVDAPMTNGQEGNGVVNGDWNVVLQPGAYRTHAGYTNQNAPTGANLYGTLVVFAAGNGLKSRTQSYYSQQGAVYTRTAWNGNDFGTWRRLAWADDSGAAVFDGSTSVVLSPGVAINTGSVSLTKSNGTATLDFHLQGTSSVNVLLSVPTGYRPRPGNPADDFLSTSANGGTYYGTGVALDPDGFLRVRSPNLPSAWRIFGTMTWPVGG